MTEFKELTGKTLTAIVGGIGDDEMVFHTNIGNKYELFHYKD